MLVNVLGNSEYAVQENCKKSRQIYLPISLQNLYIETQITKNVIGQKTISEQALYLFIFAPFFNSTTFFRFHTSCSPPGFSSIDSQLNTFDEGLNTKVKLQKYNKMNLHFGILLIHFIIVTITLQFNTVTIHQSLILL